MYCVQHYTYWILSSQSAAKVRKGNILDTSAIPHLWCEQSICCKHQGVQHCLWKQPETLHDSWKYDWQAQSVHDNVSEMSWTEASHLEAQNHLLCHLAEMELTIVAGLCKLHLLKAIPVDARDEGWQYLPRWCCQAWCPHACHYKKLCVPGNLLQSDA